MRKNLTKFILAILITIFSASAFFAHPTYAAAKIFNCGIYNDKDLYETCMKLSYGVNKKLYKDCSTIDASTKYQEYLSCTSQAGNYDSQAGIKYGNPSTPSYVKFTVNLTQSQINDRYISTITTCINNSNDSDAYNACLLKAKIKYNKEKLSHIPNINTSTPNLPSNSSNDDPNVVDDTEDRNQTGNPGGTNPGSNNGNDDPNNNVDTSGIDQVPATNNGSSQLLPAIGEDSVNWAVVNESFEGRTGDACQGFLGLTSWDCGVNISDQDSLVNGISLIAVNVLTDITIIAAYLVLGYVIYGGYLYIFSTGDPGKVAAGKKTLTQAFIGLAIVMSANVIMNGIRFALLGANGAFNCDLATGTGTGCVDANTAVTNAIQWVIGIGGVVAAIFVVYGGVGYITSTGDPSKIQKAKQTILYALIGLIIVAVAEALTATVSGIIRNANQGAFLVNETIISKELHEKNT